MRTVKHSQTSFISKGKIITCDVEIKELLHVINDMYGVITVYSCQGEGNTVPNHRAYISFEYSPNALNFILVMEELSLAHNLCGKMTREWNIGFDGKLLLIIRFDKELINYLWLWLSNMPEDAFTPPALVD